MPNLTDEEADFLLDALVETRGSSVVDRYDVLYPFLEWFAMAKFRGALFDLALAGLVEVDWDEETREPSFRSKGNHGTRDEIEEQLNLYMRQKGTNWRPWSAN